MEDLSIIIVTYNVEDIINRCLESLQIQTYENFEVIIIDNGSKDNTSKITKKFLPLLPKAQLIQNSKNLGTCSARNQGIRLSSGEYIVTLDSDVILTQNFLDIIVNFLKYQEESVGIIGCKIMQLNNENIIDSTGLVLTRSLRFYDRGYGEIDKGQYDDKTNILGACAAAALYKKEMLDDIKQNSEYFDSKFFYLVEDFDIALSAKRKGWKTVFCSQAVCYHKRNGSNTSRQYKQYLTFRNRYYLLIKNKNYKKIEKNTYLFVLYDIFRLPFLLFTNPHTIKAIKKILNFYINCYDKDAGF